jgi:hypothetical protein
MYSRFYLSPSRDLDFGLHDNSYMRAGRKVEERSEEKRSEERKKGLWRKDESWREDHEQRQMV